MKKRIVLRRKYLIIIVLLLVAIIGTMFVKNNVLNKETKIDKVLKSKNYSYLPKEAKEYIKSEYEDTGEIILTEKNKEEDIAYLNPDYVKYLERGKSSEYGYIPEPFTIDHSYKKDSLSEKQGDPNPIESLSYYNLRDDGYITNIYDQGSEGICWAFASTTSLESHLAIKTNKQTMLTFSEKQVDYATTKATNAIDIGTNPFIFDNEVFGEYLNEGGNMIRYVNATAIGISPVLCQGNCSNGVDYNSNNSIIDNRYWKYNYNFNSRISPYEVTNIDNTEYSVNGAVFFNSLVSDDQEEVDALVGLIKNQIVNNGSLYVGVGAYSNLSVEYTPTAGETALNTSGKNVIYYIPSGWNPSSGMNHAVSVIGWDDNYTHNICLNKTAFEITNANKVGNNYSCSKGTLYTINGAWILQNSWGQDANTYIYLPYASMKSTYSSISDVEAVDYDNSYRATARQTNFSKGAISERLNKVKFFVSSYNQTIKIYYNSASNSIIINDGSKSSSGTLIKTIKTTQPGLYTANLFDENIIFDENVSTITFTFDTNDTDYNYFASIHTNNVAEEERYIDLTSINKTYETILQKCETNNNKCISQSKELIIEDNNALIISGISRNLTSNDNLTFKVLNSNEEDITNQFHIFRNFSVSNYINAIISYNNATTDLGTYMIEVYYDGVKYDELEWNLTSHRNTYEGLGTESSPYKIKTNQDLNNIRNKPSAHYILENDLDLTNDTKNSDGLFYNSGKGWDPIDNFSGDFDGNNHVITGLYINRPNEESRPVGLFGKITPYNSCFKNLIFKNANITGKYNAGTLIGKADKSKGLEVHDISVIDSTIIAEGEIGGVIGNINIAEASNYNFYNIFSNATVGHSTTGFSGGIIGTTGSYDYNFNMNFTDIVSLGTVIGKNAAGGVIDDIFGASYKTKDVDNNITFNNIISIGNYSSSNSGEVGDIFATISSLDAQSTFSNSLGANAKLNMNNIYYLHKLYDNSMNINANGTIGTKTKFAKFGNVIVYNTIANFEHKEDWIYPIVNDVKRIPMLKTMVNHFNFINPIDDFDMSISSSKNIYTLIRPALTSNMIKIEYTYDDEYLTINNGIITPKKIGTTTLHIESLYDGYAADIQVNIKETVDITYHSNYGEDETITKAVFTNQDTTLDENTFSRKGYEFTGWNTEADGSGTLYTDGQTVENGFAENIDLHAQWKQIEYTITFDANGGTGAPLIWALSYPETGKVSFGKGYTKENYTLECWNTKADGSGIDFSADINDSINFDDIPFDENYEVTVYAQWKKVEYTVTFDSNDHTATPAKTQVFTFDETKALDLNTFTRPGYTYTGWNTKEDGTGTSYTDGQVVTLTKSIILYAQWDPIIYLVTFNANGGTGAMEDEEFYYKKLKYLTPNEFTRERYAFVGWNTKADGSGEAYDDEALVSLTESKTLYAQWKKVEFTVTFNSNSGTGEMESQEYTYNVSQKLRKNTFVKEDNRFTGWNTEADGSGTSYTDEQSISIDDDLILYAQWSEIFVTITANPESVDFGETYINFSEHIKRKVKIKNEGNVRVKLSIKNPTTSGPFGSLSFENNKELDPGEEYEITLIANKSSAQASIPGTYNGNYKITATSLDGLISSELTIPGTVVVKKYPMHIAYTTHVENIGWQSYVKDGAMAGTSGKSLRLEGIKIKLENPDYSGNILYRTHIQNIGWEKDFKKNDEMSGTSGKSYRLEAIEIKLDGEMAEHYDIYYRVHAENFGWLGWARNGEQAGTAGYSYRLEAIEIKLIEKGQSLAGYGEKDAFKDKNEVSSIKLNKTNITLEVGEEETLTSTINPTNATNKTVTWTSDNESVAKVENGKIIAVSTGIATITARTHNGKETTCNVNIIPAMPGVTYTTHVENIGWQGYVKNGAMAGTSGKSLRLEGIKIKLKNQEYTGNILYRTHIQNIGWEKDFKKNDEMSGTSGKSYRLEAIEIKLDGEMAEHYDIYYRVHAENFGWLGWARNGEQSGTSGYSYRLEAIEIKLIEKGQLYEEYGNKYTFIDKTNGKVRPIGDNKKIVYTTHVQNIGWQDYVSDGAMAGTSGKSLRLEGIKIKLANQQYKGNILYRTHIQNIGWEKDFKKNYEMSGTSGKEYRLEAIEIKLDGEMAEHFDVYYQVHAENFGWLGWARNGERAGTAGYSYRLEGIKIKLIPKTEELSEYGQSTAFKEKK